MVETECAKIRSQPSSRRKKRRYFVYGPGKGGCIAYGLVSLIISNATSEIVIIKLAYLTTHPSHLLFIYLTSSFSWVVKEVRSAKELPKMRDSVYSLLYLQWLLSDCENTIRIIWWAFSQSKSVLKKQVKKNYYIYQQNQSFSVSLSFFWMISGLSEFFQFFLTFHRKIQFINREVLCLGIVKLTN